MQQPLTGGAPNNFLLLKANKSAAPFTSTVPRFQEAAKSVDLGPGQYSTERNFSIALDSRNNADMLYPGHKRQSAFLQEERWRHTAKSS